MKEASKAMFRRLAQTDFATRYFVGQGLDIAAATDPIAQYSELFPAIKGVRLWDGIDGDAQYLTGLADNSFDFVHASHALQRMPDPREALRHWFRVLRPGGHLIVVVPDEDMYEQGFWPSRHNHGNRWTFTVFKTKSWSPVSINLLEAVQVLGAQADIRRLEVLAAGFRHTLPRFDQSLTPVAECAIEVVIRKRPQAEAVAGGRVNADGTITASDVFVMTGLRVEPPKA
ncbi:SAM-dependent methyltransferase [Paramagnetospirillum kuznetsovii]|uniref:SAM-dependent methyltransferase n=1 Tax=Paramagnetospirillum kuznetsovii TaxID=2053833 RepID=A0A364NWS6_9PROT|nr:class I SAM-dependent methyltransferase [Paramagnetospirillum kuznetsovii]RAU21544.1 SAM-dependent methyltransferase [Paramagnetospirillum kuznetsovii]